MGTNLEEKHSHMTLTTPGWPILSAAWGTSVLSALPLSGKEDGRSCKKVTIRMTIRKNDCRSNTPVRGEMGTAWAGGCGRQPFPRLWC